MPKFRWCTVCDHLLSRCTCLLPGHTKADYPACLEYAKRHHYWAMYNAMAEEGYDPLVNWAELMKETE